MTDLQTSSDRINWLERAYTLLRDELLIEAPETTTISYGFPSRGAKPGKHTLLGQAHYGFMKDCDMGTDLLVLSPSIFDNPLRVLDVLLHEMIHLARPSAKHGKLFKELAVRCGLTGAMTATVASPELKDKLMGYMDNLGDMPKGHGELTPAKKRQGTRMLKYECPDCHQIIRAAGEVAAKCTICDEHFLLAK